MASVNEPSILLADSLVQADGANGLEFVTINGQTFLFVAARNDDAIYSYRVNDQGELSPATAVGDTAATALNGAYDIAVHTTSMGTYLYVSGFDDDGITVFQVNDFGGLVFQESIFNDPGLELNGPTSFSIVDRGGETFLITSVFFDWTAQVFRIEDDGTLTATSFIADDSSLAIRSPIANAAVQINGNTFVFVAGLGDNGFSTFSLDDFGVLTFVETVTDTALTSLSQPRALEITTIGDRTFLFVAGEDDGISVFEIGNDGRSTNVGTVLGDGTTVLSSVYDLEIILQGGVQYLLATDDNSGTIITFLIDENIGLIPATTLPEEASDLSSSNYADVTIIGDTIILGIGSNSGDEIATYIFDNGRPLAPPVIGTANGEFLRGAEFSDIIEGRGGSDRLVGLAGNDTLVGEDGGDTLDGGEGDDELSGGRGNDRASGRQGNDSVDGDAGNDTLLGNSGNDTLNGGNGNDQIRAGSGNDSATGGVGLDTINGENGNDTLFGNDGADVIRGGRDEDTLLGGGGNDVLFGDSDNDDLDGGSGNDTLNGGAGNDTLKGRSGVDVLQGGRGNDLLILGGSEDTVIFEKRDGRDVVRSFTDGIDIIDLRDFDFNNFQEVKQLARNNGNDLVINFDTGDRLTIEDLARADFNNADVMI